jgi:hypothetical protein
MKKNCLYCVVFLFCSLSVHAQLIPGPHEKTFDKQFLKSTNYEMACFALYGGKEIEVSSFTVQVHKTNSRFSVYTSLKMLSTGEQWIDTSVADANTMKPLYRSSFNPDREMRLKFGREITGYFINKKSKEHTLINEQLKEPFFDGYIYPYLLSALPLTSGYKGNLPVYDFKEGKNSHYKTTRIEEVKSSMYNSEMTGEHQVWQVSVFEEATGERYQYFIDKKDRKLWKINILAANGQQFVLYNKELDYNPFTTTFNKNETLKLVESGTAVISGVSYKKDNENEGPLSGIAVLNINKKQYAPSGTSVLLIPYTEYFKEWVNLNEKLRKKGRAIPLSNEAAECIKVTTVYDNDGHFEFTNLMPGTYLLYTEFGYVHTSVRTEVTGYTDTYINGMFAGSSERTATSREGSNAIASIKKIVTIKKEGEKLEIKLKQTL